jgi:predicted molibdopterin-dependent oxidoreductase YjgC
MIKAAGSSELKALYVLGENPVGVLSRESLKAMDGLEFLVVQDLFLTETASRAHVVLPGAGFAEKDGTYTSLERRIQRIRSAVKPPDEAKPDWWILSEILNRSGVEGEYDSAADVMGEISNVVPGYEGVKYSRLEGGGLFWPCSDERSSGETILHRGGLDQVKLGWEGEDSKGAVLEVDPEFPWLALRGETHFHCTGGSRSGRSRRLREYFSDCQVQLHPEDMTKLTLSQGDTARLISRKGEIKARAFESEEVPKGVVLMIPGLVGGAMGELIDWELDPLTKMPQLHAVSVRIEREGGEE